MGEVTAVRFYEITLHSAPAIRFAYRVSLDHYENTFFRKQHLLEFAITEENSTVFHHADGSMDTAAPQTLMGITNCLNCTTSSITDARNVHTTVGIRAEYTACCRDSTQITDLPAYIKTVRDANIILIPFLLPLGSQYPLLLSRLQEIILLHHSDKPADRINAISRWYALCAMLTDLVLQKLGNAHPQLSPAGENYVDRAEAYIKSRLSEKITVAALAAHLSISEAPTKAKRAIITGNIRVCEKISTGIKSATATTAVIILVSISCSFQDRVGIIFYRDRRIFSFS